MFLNSLLSFQIAGFSKWIESLFGYGLSVQRHSSGHLSINLESKGIISNIVDTGYGVSQILPVLGQIWWARSRYRGPGNSLAILAIEQPELHLHPAHQALLADALVGELSAEARRVHFLIETHSETLINRLGELISQQRMSTDDVQIVLFQPDEQNEHWTNVHISTFGPSGELLDWPYGFFQPAR
jgi:predicted ATPase